MNYWLISLFIISITKFGRNEAAIIETSGCFHNGTLYAEGSFVPTTEPCLSCKCNARMLICSLKVCPEMPVPPPRGCILVQKKSSCCPYLSCLKVHAVYNLPSRRIVSYLDHFERESIDRAVNDNFLQRRSDDSDLDGSGEICVKNGTVYKSGSAMSSSSLCSYCYCIGGQQKCVKPKCMLPLDGCKAIFVDSTCCPVRYDCTSKSSGKSSHRSHARKTGNKHFQRMSQGFQRNRGCTVGAGNGNFYPEGQKMPRDIDAPCDICFCIRGTRKCAPKKCSPPLRNCVPVIPKGQCCPSSYECGSAGVKDHFTRSYQARQIGLFNLIFGPDDNSTDSTGPDEQFKPTAQPTIEKTIFDVIREGLEYIDSNTNGTSTTTTTTTTLPSTTLAASSGSSSSAADDDGASFFDILMGNSLNLPLNNTTATATATTTTSNATSDFADDLYKDYDEGLSFFDLLLGKTNSSTATETVKRNSSLLNDITTGNYDFDYFGSTENETAYYDYLTGSVASTDQQQGGASVADEMTTTASVLMPENRIDWTDADDDYDFGTTESSSLLTSTEDHSESTTTDSEIDYLSSSTIQPEFSPTTDNQIDISSTIFPEDESTTNIELLATTTVNPITTTATTTTTTTTYASVAATESTTHEPQKLKTDQQNTTLQNSAISDDIFTSLLNGLSNLLGEDENTIENFRIQNVTKVANFSDKSSNIEPPLSPPSAANRIVISSTQRPTASDLPAAPPVFVTENPAPALIIKTNPSILDLPYDYGHRTLPPSLPNLKIIPFLPVDALPTAEKRQTRPPYLAEQQPALTWSHATVESEVKSVQPYDVQPADHYPSLTYQQDPDSSDSYTGSRHGFSPPTKTEGGFVPKDPNLTDNLYYGTKLTTPTVPDSIKKPATEHTILIDITSVDPFKNVIKTESAPDLSSLFEDHPHHQDIIHITTDANYNYTPEYKQAFDFDYDKESLNVSQISFTEKNDIFENLNKSTHDVNDNNISHSSEPNKIGNFFDYLLKDKGILIGNSSTSIPPFRTVPQDLQLDKFITTTERIQLPEIDKIAATKQPSPQRPSKPTVTRKTKPSSANRNQQLQQQIAKIKDSNSSADDLSYFEKLLLKTESHAATHKPIPDDDDLSYFEKLLLKTEFTVPDSELYKPIPQRKMTTVKEYENKMASAITTTNDPFKGLPLTQSYPVKPLIKETPPHKDGDEHSSTEIDMILSHINKKAHIKGATYTVGAYKLLPNDTMTSTNTDSMDSVYPVQEPPSHVTPAEIITKSNLNDPAGILLAGCNIYGRMYRVGRIISELSDACLECKCTEIGVSCMSLECVRSTD